MATPEEIVRFWIDETGPDGWYNGSDALDDEIRTRFMTDWEVAHDGGLTDWQVSSKGVLAYLILTDQFPRNMFRGDARSFATDEAALICADAAIRAGLDLQIELPTRQFFYTPFMHSEKLTDQDRGVALMLDRMSDPRGEGDTLHARVHREIIKTFGRFPYRNDALGRDSRPEEITFIKDGGYATIRDAMQKRDE